MLNIDNLIKEALKAKKPVDLKVYRNLKSDILAFKTQKNAPEYTEEQEIKVIQKYAKKLEDSITEFEKAGRGDLAEEYREELNVLQGFLPKPVSELDIYEELVHWATKNHYIEEEPACEIKIPKKEMGAAVKHIKSVLPGADGKLIADVVKSHLE